MFSVSYCRAVAALLLKVYTNKNHLLDEAHGGGSDAEDGRGPQMIYFDLKVTRCSFLLGVRLHMRFSLEHTRRLRFSVEIVKDAATISGREFSQLSSHLFCRSGLHLAACTQKTSRRMPKESLLSDRFRVVVSTALLGWCPKGIRLPREDVGRRDTSERRREPPGSGLGPA